MPRCWRAETSARPQEKQWSAWRDAQLTKVAAALAAIEQQAEAFSRTPDDLGLIAIGCGLGYLDFRFAELNWRATHPQSAAVCPFDAHPAMAATRRTCNGAVMSQIFFLNGPNANLYGMDRHGTYGSDSFASIGERCQRATRTASGCSFVRATMKGCWWTGFRKRASRQTD